MFKENENKVEEKPGKRKPRLKIVDHKETEEYRLGIRNRTVNEVIFQELQNWAEEFGYFLPPDAANLLNFAPPYMGPFGRMTCATSPLSGLVPTGPEYILFDWRTSGKAISVIIRVGKEMLDNTIILAERIEKNIPPKLPQDLELKEVQVIKY